MIFLTKFSQKGCFQSKTENVNTTIEFYVFKLVYKPNFNLNWQFWFLGPTLPKKGISSQKQKKWTSSLNSAYSKWSRYKMSAYTDSFDFFWPKLPEKIFPVENGKIALARASIVVTYYIILFQVGRQTQRFFNFSSPSSLIDNKIEQLLIKIVHCWFIYNCLNESEKNHCS